MDLVTPLLAQVDVANINVLILGIISLLAGILILAVPRVLNYVVAAYLIIVGVLWIIAGL
jgi:uncharacterized membrane protein HdeD (DUF308 family)